MELAEIRPFEPQMAEIDLFTMPDAVGVGEPSVRKVKPYIAGHVTDGSSTFTFTVNGSDVTVSVSGGNWKYKPTAAITSLAFVGVPQLESLELNKITGVSIFNLDYPVVPVFKGCDATTEAALNYVYHIRGTATEDFTFTLKYIDEGNNVTEVTESAVIDENGKWDVAYSSKKIKELASTFSGNTQVESIEFTDTLDECTSIVSCFSYSTTNISNIVSIKFADGTTLPKIQSCNSVFAYCNKLTSIVNFPYSVFNQVTNCNSTFRRVVFTGHDFSGVTFEKVTNFDFFLQWYGGETLNIGSFNNTNTFSAASSFGAMMSLKEFIVPQNSQFGADLNMQYSPLSYESMLRIAGWLKDLSGGTAKTVTFNSSKYNALTAEQKSALNAIIVTEKGWNLATA